jgi:DNA-binding NtrC family response regulator
VKLLRVLQEGEVKRVGSNETRLVDVRVIAATNVELKARIAEGKFREDLFYRLNVVAIELPSLRARRDDVPLLAYHFLRKYAGRTGRDVKKISAEAMKGLQAQPWPGNVRELENAIEHAVVFCANDAVQLTDLPFARKQSQSSDDAPVSTELALPMNGILDLPYREAKQRAVAAFERSYFTAVLDRSGGNVSEAARQAGLDRSNFRRAARRAGTGSRE